MVIINEKHNIGEIKMKNSTNDNANHDCLDCSFQKKGICLKHNHHIGKKKSYYGSVNKRSQKFPYTLPMMSLQHIVDDEPECDDFAIKQVSKRSYILQKLKAIVHSIKT